jgi:hypothetical protein
MLGDLVCNVAGGLLDAGDVDESLKTLFAKHSNVDFGTERQARALEVHAQSSGRT